MTFARYLKDEAGTATVDWVVLTTGATGIAIALMTLYTFQIEELSGALSPRLRDRPAYAYEPHDALAHLEYVNRMRDFTIGELNVLTLWASSVRKERPFMSDDARAAFDDLDNAITVAHARVYASRPNVAANRDQELTSGGTFDNRHVADLLERVSVAAGT